MNEKNTTIDVEMEKDFVIIKCRVQVLEISGLEFDWGNEIDSVVHQLNGRALIIDFSKVVILSSAALQHLIQLYFLAKETHFKFGLCGMNSGITETLNVTRLNTLFTIASDIDELKAKLGK